MIKVLPVKRANAKENQVDEKYQGVTSIVSRIKVLMKRWFAKVLFEQILFKNLESVCVGGGTLVP